MQPARRADRLPNSCRPRADAGGGFQNYPEDYAVIQKLDDDGQLTLRLAYNLCPQKPKEEKEDFLNCARMSKYKQGNDYFRHISLKRLAGAGGFEPPYGGIKIRCLTAWRRPKGLRRLIASPRSAATIV
jgi:hypothetical protein